MHWRILSGTEKEIFNPYFFTVFYVFTDRFSENAWYVGGVKLAALKMCYVV